LFHLEALGKRRPRFHAQRPHDPVVPVIALQDDPGQVRQALTSGLAQLRSNNVSSFRVQIEWAVNQHFAPDAMNDPASLYADAMSYISNQAPDAQPPWGQEAPVNIPEILDMIRHVGGVLQDGSILLHPKMARRMREDNRELFVWLRSMRFVFRKKVEGPEALDGIRKILDDMDHVLHTAFTDDELKEWEDEAQRAAGLS
jgi:hypothetical protein